MKVLLLERNLIWTSKLAQSLRAAGYEVEVSATVPENCDAMIAIINLSDHRTVDIDILKAKGIKTIAHAGHKEKQLLSLGERMGCDRVVSNSEITNKLPSIIGEMFDEG